MSSLLYSGRKQRRYFRVLTVIIIAAMVITTLGFSTTGVSAVAKKPTKISLKATAKIVDLNGTVKVSVRSVKPAGASKAVTFKSSNSKIASVSSSGTVKGKKTGTVTIIATSKKTSKIKASIKLKVMDLKPSAVKLNKSKLTLSVMGKSVTLRPGVEPAGVYNKGVTYKSSDTKIATVNSKGTVTAVSPGTAKITAITKESSRKAVCTVTVSDKNVLNGWVMTGYWRSDSINNTSIADDVKVQMWDSSRNKFVSVENTETNITGNYVQLYDLDNDKTADYIQIVKYSDGSKFWNAETTWINDAGDTGDESSCLSDKDGRKMFSQKHRIPMGERLLSTYGLGSYSGTTDFANYESSPYYENTDYDFYTLDSSDTLTMLTGYRTALQTTGSTCVMTSALSVLEWYGVRGDLNERDLASLRGENRAGKVGGTSLGELKQVFKKLGSLGLTGRWNMKSWEGDEKGLYDSEWIQSELSKGHPIMVIWNSFGAHGQVIIGYDNMGTDVTNDDILIMMDPYDSTDHNADGYIIQSYERLAYGLLTWSDTGTTGTKYLSVYPKEWDYAPVSGDGMLKSKSNTSDFSNSGKLSYRYTADDIQSLYPSTPYLIGGLAGAASVERSGDYNMSPYFSMLDCMGSESEVRENIGSDTLKILDNFKTIQQSTEWTCGTASALMTIEWFGMNRQRNEGASDAGQYETDVSLASIRQIEEGSLIGATGATYRDGMKEVFDYMNKEYDQDWTYFTNLDLDDPYGEESYIGEYCLQAGGETPDWKGLIPYLIDSDIPMMIGSDDWGGHWQVIIGYDSMGTEGTQDDILIVADPYDTTDHNQNGYYLKSFERLVYGWGSAFEADENGDGGSNDFIVAFPAKGHEKVIKTLGLQ